MLVTAVPRLRLVIMINILDGLGEKTNGVKQMEWPAYAYAATEVLLAVSCLMVAMVSSLHFSTRIKGMAWGTQSDLERSRRGGQKDMTASG